MIELKPHSEVVWRGNRVRVLDPRGATVVILTPCEIQLIVHATELKVGTHPRKRKDSRKF